MESMTRRAWIAFSAFTWFFLGLWLLYKGLRLLTEGAFQPDTLSHALSRFFVNQQQAATALLAVALLVGFLKGRLVLIKTVRRVTARLISLPSPVAFKDAYSGSYWMLIGGMMLLGISFRFLPISPDVRGAIDIAIGSALMNGSMLYLRALRQFV